MNRLKSNPEVTKEWNRRSAKPLNPGKPLSPGKPLARSRGLQSNQPIERSAPAKPRKPLPRKSKRQAAAEERYGPIQRIYLIENPKCHHCLELGLMGKDVKPSNEVHHVIGKEGERRYDTRFFMAVNSTCHTIYKDSIEENQTLSRQMGWIIDRTWTPEAQLETLTEKRGRFPWVQRELERFKSKAAQALRQVSEEAN